MNIPVRTVTSLLAFTLILNQSALALPPQAATPPAQTSTAPIPAQIAAADTIVLVNGGADADFPIPEGQSYDQVYAALKAWGRFQLVGSAADADLVFNLREIAPITDVTGTRAGTYSITTPAFRLTITDPKTHTDLWTITSPVTIVGKKDVRAHWNDIAITNLISRTKVLVDQPLNATESADLTAFPKTHGARNALIAVGGLAAIGTVTTVLVLHAMRQSQASFCNAHGIPLSECPGA